MGKISDFIALPFHISQPVHLHHVRSLTADWARKLELLTNPRIAQRYARIDAPGLAAFTNPRSNLERCFHVAKWMAWLFLLDDICDEDGLPENSVERQFFFRRLLQAFSEPQERAHSDFPLERALAYMSLEMVDLQGEPYRHQFSGLLADYFAALDWEEENRLKNKLPSLRLYTVKRRSAGAILLSFGLIDLSLATELPADVGISVKLKSIIDHAASAIGWCNDIFSFEREENAGDLHNLVLLIEHELALPREDSIWVAIGMHNERIKRFRTEAAKLIEDTPSPELASYLKAIVEWIKGAYEWSLTTPRYCNLALSGPSWQEATPEMNLSFHVLQSAVQLP